jgi:hypothetical protein
MSFWFNPITATGGLVSELDSHVPSGGWHATNIEIINGFIKYRIWNGPIVTSSTSVNLNQWHHIALVYDGTSVKGYLNGVLQGSQAGAREIPSTSQNYAIGAGETTNMGTAAYGNFHLSQFKIHNLSLSDKEIQMELDLHFSSNEQKYVVDFKSGFGSNEKGNTNRLLLVATIYKNLDANFKCLLFVRAEENNSYFHKLKNSGIWEASCGSEAYQKISEYSGYNLKIWIDTNIDWKNDFNTETIQHLTDNNLLQYLLW